MSTNDTLSASNELSTNTDLSTMKLITIKGHEHDHLKRIDKVEALPRSRSTVDLLPSTLALLRTKPSTMLSKTNVSCCAASSVCALSSAEKTRKTTSTDATSKISRRHKHHHHHHHHGRKHHCHHHRQHRAKSVEAVRHRSQSAILSPTKVIIGNSARADAKQSIVVVEEGKMASNTSHSHQHETVRANDQQAPVSVYRSVDSNQYEDVNNSKAHHVSMKEGHESKTNKGNIPLQSVENSMRSQRMGPVDERQVGNYPTIVTMGGPQQMESICYDDSCCLPQSSTSCLVNSCVAPQTDQMICAPQQPVLYCSDGSCGNYLCSPSTNNIIQSASFIQQPQQQQQQYICVSNTSSASQPTVINQIPVMSSVSAQSSAQPLLCIPQTRSVVLQQQPQIQPQTFQIIQQQPQLQPQTFQIVQQQAQSQPQTFQIIQAPQQQTPQYIQISSASPQLIQASQPQSALQTIQASPQLLYQRPYDPIIVPVQNQQLAIGNAPLVSLSQPSYAPARLISATPDRKIQGPQMFRHALVRTVANRTGQSVPLSMGGGGQLLQSPMLGSIGSGVSQSPFSSHFSNKSSHQTAGLPFIPLSAGGLLIPFQPSMPNTDKRQGPLPRIGGYPSNLRNFDRIRQQIQQRGQLLESLQRQNYSRVPSLPVVETGAIPSLPVSPPRIAPMPVTPPVQPPRFPSLPSVPGTSMASSPILGPPSLIPSQSPYAKRNELSSSSSSSGSSSSSSSRPALSVRPSTTGLTYAQPYLDDSRSGSLLSGPSNVFPTLQ